MQVLTVTGMRPTAFRHCQRWMARQDYKGPVTWIIVDDGLIQSSIEELHDDWKVVWIRPNPLWEPGQNTQIRNLSIGLLQVDMAEPLAIIEDDDWYSPRWLSVVAEKLKSAKLVGEAPAKYYNVNTHHWYEFSNGAHASLCSTAMRDGATMCFETLCRTSGEQFIDIPLWQVYNGSLLFKGDDVVGIKGLPGRPGIGVGHHPDFGLTDEGGKVLRKWVGEDEKYYV